MLKDVDESEKIKNIVETLANPVFVNNPSLAHFQSGRNIRHLPCVVRKSGLSGVCMFAIDCIKANGTHLGTCIDRFYFGSCCQVHDESVLLDPEINDNSIDQNTISHYQHESTTLPDSDLFRITTPKTTTTTTKTSSLVDEIIATNIQNITAAIKDANSTIIPIYVKPRPTIIGTSTEIISGDGISNSSSLTTVLSTSITAELTSTQEPSTESEIVTTTISVLTTTSAPKKEPVKTTTLPTKVTTFQIVDDEITTILPSTLAPSAPPVTTLPPIIPPPKRPTKRPTIHRTTTHKTTTKVPRPTLTPVNSIHTDTTKKPPKTTTHRPHASTTKRTTAKRPVTKRPSSSSTAHRKPPKRPATTYSPTSTHSHKGNTTKFPTRKPIRTTTTTRIPITTTVLTTSSTKAPRPKPKPTAEIVKVPPTTTTEVPAHKESMENDLQTTEIPTTTTKVKPTISSTTSLPTTERVPSSSPTSTTTEEVPSTTSTSQSTTTITKATTTPSPTKTTTSSPTKTTTETLTMSTVTEAKSPPPTTTPGNLEEKPTHLTTTATSVISPTPSTIVPTVIDMTTLKPGLVTWTNLDDMPTNISSTINDTGVDNWNPVLPPDWVPLVTISPTVSTTTSASSNVPILLDEVSTKGPEVTPSTQSTETPTTQKPSAPPVDLTTLGVPVSGVDLESPTSPISIHVDSTTEGIISNDTISGQIMVNETTSSTNVSSSTAPPVSFEGIDYRQLCGKRMFPEPRIVGGSNAAFGRWPWQISLRQWRTSTYLHKCGAALLNENWAITAAHCVDNVPPSDLLLRLGEYDLAEEEEPYGYQERRVQIVASHPQFDPRTFEYDLALLRFYEPVTFQPNIIPVCVPEDDTDFIGQTAYVTGWGRLYEDGPLPSVLQEVSVPVINNTICETMYRNAGYIEHIPHIFICAGWKKGGYDSCEGDSGGPMVLQRDDKRFLLGGVISWGIGCAEPNQPGVYTRISEFRDWINQILQF
ncbi:unnamed protein product [Hermetia illucens]|uniref:Peptidase S1 domain-containing protein n=1 Tax=Hermetia illucens TaxID=343691 RepID=A0A7R8UBR2_HERIL|nr:unnamed protein product [Hermetia illucens]